MASTNLQMTPRPTNRYTRKMYNREKHRRRSAAAKALEDPAFAQKVIPAKKTEKWSYEAFLREIEDESWENIETEGWENHG